MRLTDTHAHLYAGQFDGDRDEMLKRAFSAGIEKIFLPNIDGASAPDMMSLCRAYPQHCFPMMGLHPCSVKEDFEKELEAAEKWLESEKFYAIGETGIDLYRDRSTLPLQQKAFRMQVEWAKKRQLPVVIHCRNSFDEIIEVLDDLNDESFTGIFHCFTGTLQQAKKIIDYGGFRLGIGGVVTFKNGGLDKFLGEIDLKHIVLETDAPYLAPMPYRGKRNESAYISLVAQRVAGIYNKPVEAIAEITTHNAAELFGV